MTCSHIDKHNLVAGSGISRACIVGVGNILLRDEGIGPAVIDKMLELYDFPDNVDLLDYATLGFGMLGVFRDYDLVIVVDAVDNTGYDPGTVFKFTREDIAPRATLPGAHNTTLGDVLDAAALLGYKVEGRCVGVQVEDMSPKQFDISLTPKVQEAIPLAIHTIFSILEEYSITGIKRKAD